MRERSAVTRPVDDQVAGVGFAALVLGVAGYVMVRWFWVVELDKQDLVLISGTGRRQRLRYDELLVIEVGGSVGNTRSGLMTVQTARGRSTGVRVTGEGQLLAELAERAPLASMRGG